MKPRAGDGRFQMAPYVLVLGLVLAAAVVATYLRTTSFGLFSDDYDWLSAARAPGVAHLWSIEGRTQFYRPVVGTYFALALEVCGHSTACYHWLSLALHWGTGMLTAGMVASVSGSLAVGALAGVLFVVQPAPVEAVAWVGAVGEILATLTFVATVWLFRTFAAHGHRAAYAAALVTFPLCLLSHESGVALLPVLVAGLVWLPPAEGTRTPWLALMPFGLMLAAYGVVAYSINSKGALIGEGTYAVGWHIASNALGALATFTVARRDAMSLTLLGAGLVAVLVWGTPPLRWCAVWAAVTLLPFTLFQRGFSSRYLYLTSVGMSAVMAELLWHARAWSVRWPRVGTGLWAVVVLVLTVRFGVFAAENARNLRTQRFAYDAYAESVQRLYPVLPPGARLTLPLPPESVPVRYVEPLLRWTYEDAHLTVAFDANAPQP